MVGDRNKFVVAHNTWFDQEQRIKEGKGVPRKDYSMALARRARTRGDAKISAAIFEEAVRAKASLADNKPLQEEKPASQQKSDLSNKEKVKNLVRKEALEQELDPDIIEKLAQADSGFRKEAVNKKTGATGIMQLIPETAELIAAKTAWSKDKILHDPETRVKAAIWLIKEYKTLFDGKVKDEDSLLTSVAAYKTSPQAVDKAIKQTKEEKPSIEKVLKQKAFPEKAKKSIEKIQGPTVEVEDIVGKKDRRLRLELKLAEPLSKEDLRLKRELELGKPVSTEELPPGWPGSSKLFREFITGTGPANRLFTEGSPQVEDMKTSIGVQRAKEKYRDKYNNLLLNSKKNVGLTGTSYTNYRFTFRLFEFLDAGFNPTQQFVGSYRVDIYGLPNGKVKIEVSNKTSFKSFLYQIPGIPNWAREKFGPMGNITQKFIWTEKISP